MFEDLNLKTSDGVALYAKVVRASGHQGTVLILHGLHDHSGRYDHVASHFASMGLSTFQFDLRGNGRSEGKRGYIKRFGEHILDCDAAVSEMKEQLNGPYFAFAHSMGALILSTWILEHDNPFRGIVYSGGLFKVNEDISPILQKLSGTVSKLFPSLPTIKLDFRELSREPEVLELSKTDTLQYRGGVRARTGAEVIDATAALQTRLSKLNFPMLIMHGEKDGLTKYEASELLYEKSTSGDKTLKIYQGAKHEIFNETNRAEVLHDATEWIRARVNNM